MTLPSGNTGFGLRFFNAKKEGPSTTHTTKSCCFGEHFVLLWYLASVT